MHSVQGRPSAFGVVTQHLRTIEDAKFRRDSTKKAENTLSDRSWSGTWLRINRNRSAYSKSLATLTVSLLLARRAHARTVTCTDFRYDRLTQLRG